MRRNCWEIKKCEREPGGTRTQEFGICPAAVERRLEGIHGGRRGGRACWVIAGTFCGGTIQGTFASKYDSCAACEVYRMVKEEEAEKFQLSPVLMKRLRADQGS